ncbi:RluA family pseudouridine synthase [Pelotomaculum terephthalicicum JT]|uniref:RluA family pseudouridine synthase n=1 Tax=Pelotomaculum TaxID=191373 RepID=UPI0009D1D150|nr:MULTISPECIES: RluA family pseudouridine synthase [Pelotomaculum]MCG9969540.1 RluA family pseudouridine synthase [Pelotomaculum terephthalicicum JT]OPX86124.1 MAG: Ribosomal large subunit pseudouridine synthase D [Pelotomaculum sp. PtaB.Bin117]OPY59545.1 MAG: Ribosomal large subunit pseudouridine synthase D [Pelotomaculum sp. PtaU1.Bin035]
MPGFSSFEVDTLSDGKRLDVFLAGAAGELSRSFTQKLITDGMVMINGEIAARASYKVRTGELITVNIPPPGGLEVNPEPIPLDIYYEDGDIIVVNKPRGMVVHPAAGNYAGTLVNALLYHCRDLSGINGVMRPGIVHRLDKNTSGLIMAAKNDAAHASLAGQLKDRQVKRRYLALAHGQIKEESGMVDAPIGRDPRNRQKMAVLDRNSKQAVTRYQVLDRFAGYTYLKLQLETGRTHQIRVHLAYIGHPVVGDPKYGPARPHFNLDGQFLHAAVLGFKHPRTGLSLEFEAPLPDELKMILEKLIYKFPLRP